MVSIFTVTLMIFKFISQLNPTHYVHPLLLSLAFMNLKHGCPITSYSLMLGKLKSC